MTRILRTLLLATALVATATAADAQTPAREMMCEGRSARITRNFAQTARNETPVTFMLRLDTANRQATIMGVQGARVVRPGRHPLTGEARRPQIVMNWTDSTNTPQNMTITFERDGSFHGQTGQVPVNTQAGALACGLMGDFCGMMQMTAQTEIIGVCWTRD